MNYKWIIQEYDVILDLVSGKPERFRPPFRLNAPNSGFYDMHIDIVYLNMGRHYVPRDGWIKGLY